jgi:predicted phosphate transport protein (TIGR00153 family)
MLRWFQALMPREDRFFGLFNQHALTLVDGSGALAELLHARASVPDASRRVMDFENQADVITRDVLTLTRRSFITPFDRSDIKELITALDDAIDQMQKTAKAIVLFEVSGFEPHMAQMGDIIVDAAKLTVDAVALLGSMRQQAVRLNAITEEIIRLEESADGLHDLGIKELYVKYRAGNAMDFIVGTEIYDHLERVMDRFEDVANCISGIAIEQA